MTTLLGQLLTPPARQPLSFEAKLALEAATAEAEQLLNDDIVELIEARREHESTVVDITKSEQLSAGLDELVSTTIDDYSTSGMSNESAALFRLSVESIFKASGMDIDLKQSFASFEAGGIKDIASATKSHVGGMMKQISEWLSTLMARLREIAATVIARLRTSHSSIKNYLAAVENKLKRVSKAEPGKSEVSMGSSADYLVDRSDRIGKPDSNITINTDLYGDFIIEWENHWRPLLTFTVPTLVRGNQEADAFAEKVKELSMKAARPELDIRFIVSHHIELDAGKGNNPLLGTELKITQSAKAKSEQVPVLSRVDIRHGLDTARSALKVLEQTERSIQTLISTSQRFNAAVKTVKVETEQEAGAAKFREAIRALGKVSSLANDGYLNTIPVYLRALKANVRYIDLSVNEYL